MANALYILPEKDPPFACTYTLSATGGSWPYTTGTNTITAVNQGTKVFTVSVASEAAADALVAVLWANRLVVVSGSTGNDGVYTVVVAQAVLVVADWFVEITVSEAIPSAVADGALARQTVACLMVVAWDTEDETDYHGARFITYSFDDVQASSPYYCSANNIGIGAGNNDLITLNWSAPRRRPNHYAVYYQLDAVTYNPLDVGYKLLPTSGTVRGQIPGYATSVVLPNNTAITENRTLPIISVDADNEYYYLPGNVFTCCKEQNITINGGGGVQAVTATVLGRSDGGEHTRVTVAAATADATYATISVGRFIVPGLDSDYIILDYPDIQIAHRDRKASDIHGLPYQRSYIRAGSIAGIRVVWPVTADYAEFVGGGVASGLDAKDAMYYLQKWRDMGKPLEFWIWQDTGVHHYPEYLFGWLEEIPGLGLKDVQDVSEMEFTARIFGEIPNRYDVKWFTVVTRDSTDDYIVIDGDWRHLFPAGTKLRLVNTTDSKDGLYCVSTTAMTGSDTKITTTTDPGTTDDGIVELWLWR